MTEIFLILLGAILVDNFVLTRFMGVCPFIGVSRKVSSAFGMSMAVLFVMVLATAVTFPIYTYILVPFELEYLKTLCFILVIALFVQLTEIAVKRFIPPLFKALGIYLPLITTNCAVLGLTLLNLDKEYTFAQSLVHALGAGIGFMVAMLIFSGIREKLEYSDIPKMWQGVPAAMLAAGIVSASFAGFAGLAG